AEADSILDEAGALHERLKQRLASLPTPDRYYHLPERVFAQLERYRRIDKVPFRGGRKDIIDFACQPHPSFGSRLDLLIQTTSEYDSAGINYFIATDTKGQAARLDELIGERVGVENTPLIETADLKGGFVCRQGRFAILTDHEIFSRHHRRVRKKRFKEGVAISDYSNLAKGDHVVHTAYGVARYLGLETITVDNRSRDCLLLQYAENDRLYVPIEEFNQVSKYSGKDTAPALTRLGGPGWEKLKKKTKKAIADMAADLIKLYAERKMKSGYSFGEDTVWLKQLEASFAYEETPDQFKAINDVKYDMVEDKPMDRLICGDVGFGKTEVAIRAAFKAVSDSRQVAVLVPTTILAEQHLETFRSRLSPFPVRVEMLSRFITPARQRQIVKETLRGEVDILIGTHRLLSEDVRFKELGLVVVDEEQRFGVKHKEWLKQRYGQVDVLTLTATPIPRTLHLALMGARDISNIQTPPVGRYPIKTYIGETSDVLIGEAVGRELERGGQVFFVHNRVQSIDSVAACLQELMPGVRFCVAHGQLPSRRLESVMHDFIDHSYDVLITTTIIENGTDIPNCNTIIINRADRFGLAQLYQLRGRVGRGRHRAYAYLFTPPRRVIGEQAYRRLAAVAEFNELGSGYRLALKDLELRGAGDVLGPQQSGFVEQVGFDLYVRLLKEAVAKLRGEEAEAGEPRTQVTGDFAAYIPDDYVGSPEIKLRLYRRLAECRTLTGVDDLRREFEDRFGPLPEPVINLFTTLEVRILGDPAGVKEVRIRGRRISLSFDDFSRVGRVNLSRCEAVTDICPKIGSHGEGLLEVLAENHPLLAAREITATINSSLSTKD
ncbi:transcription-repair coupling factor, partial [bacterium]|nr:transcription-repair coupling factor [bacterium]